MASFFAELKRRHIYRVAAAYAVVAWVLIQLVNNVAPALRLPEWAPTLVIVLLLVGFPITLLAAWARELAPAEGTIAHAATGKLDGILIAALAVVIGLVSYQQLAPTPGARTARQTSASTPGASPTQAGDVSIAVLPFVNLSADQEQEFFSDGITEEITSALAKVQGLTVLGRTSAFQFKGQNKDLRDIGQALGATHLIEGSVRKAGTRVRITAQLIRADSGAHLWTENYDRELTDVFAIQENIAQAIAASLRVPLGLQQGDTLVGSRTKDGAAYEDYLRAKALLRGRVARSTRRIEQIAEAIRLLEGVLARDPDYAPAWALLGLANAYTITSSQQYLNGSDIEEGRRIANTAFPRAEAAAQRAVQLDPNHADSYLTLGRLQVSRGKLALAEDLYSKGLALDPGNPDGLGLYGNMLAEVGHLKEALATKQKVRALDLLNAGDNSNTATILWLNGQNDAAIALLKAMPPENEERALHLAQMYAAMGRYGESADTLMEIRSGLYPPEIVESAARLLRTAPRAASAPQTLPRFGYLSFAFLHVGAPDRVLELYERNIDVGYSAAIDIAFLWHPSYAPVRKTERFKTYARRAGLVDYWKVRGWPDLCKPVGADDFVCD